MELAQVHLSGRAKIDGKWRQPGEVLTVATDIAAQLEDAGVLTELPRVDAGHQNTMLSRAIEAEEHRKMLEGRVLDLQAEVEAMAVDRDAARDRATEAEAEVRSLTARNHELEAELADLKATSASVPDTDQQDNPPEQAAKTARKKGAVADMG